MREKSRISSMSSCRRQPRYRPFSARGDAWRIFKKTKRDQPARDGPVTSEYLSQRLFKEISKQKNLSAGGICQAFEASFSEPSISQKPGIFRRERFLLIRYRCFRRPSDSIYRWEDPDKWCSNDLCSVLGR